MFFLVCSGAVVVVATGTIGRGPLDHPVSSRPVFRVSGTRKAITPDTFCKNLKVPPMGKLWAQLRARKGKGSNLATVPKFRNRKIPIFGNFRFSQNWSSVVVGIAGVVGHAETCSKHPLARLAHRSLHAHDRGVLPQKSRNFKHIKISEFQNPRNLWILKISEFKKSAKSRNLKIRKYLLNGFRAANSLFTPSGLLGGLFPEELSTHSQLHATPRRPHDQLQDSMSWNLMNLHKISKSLWGRRTSCSPAHDEWRNKNLAQRWRTLCPWHIRSWAQTVH